MKIASAALASVTWLISGNAAAVLERAAADALMKKDGCAACHAVDKKIIGPSYQDVAAKYRADKDAIAKLSKKVKDGGVGVWGKSRCRPTRTFRTPTSRNSWPGS